MTIGRSRILTRLAVRMMAGVVLAGAIAAYLSFQLDNSYTARVLLILAPIPIKAQDVVPVNMNQVNEPVEHLNYFKVGLMEALAMPDYKAILTSELIAENLRNKLKERYEAIGINADSLTIEKTIRSLDVKAKVHLQTMEKVEYQQIVELLLTAKDPQIAADIANIWAELSIDTAERMRTTAKTGAVEFLETRHKQLWDEYNAAAKELEALEAQSSEQDMQQRLAEMESTVTSYQLQRSQLLTELARLEAEAAELDKQLAQVQPTVTLRKAPPEAAYWLLQDAKKDDSKVLVTEEVNPLYTELNSKRAQDVEELSGLKAQQTTIDQELKTLETQVSALRADLARVTREKKAFELKIESISKNIKELASTLEATRTAVQESVPEFKIASRAVPPEEKSGPHRSLMIIAAMFAAAVAVPVHFFGMLALRKYALTIEKEAAA